MFTEFIRICSIIMYGHQYIISRTHLCLFYNLLALCDTLATRNGYQYYTTAKSEHFFISRCLCMRVSVFLVAFVYSHRHVFCFFSFSAVLFCVSLSIHWKISHCISQFIQPMLTTTNNEQFPLGLIGE